MLRRDRTVQGWRAGCQLRPAQRPQEAILARRMFEKLMPEFIDEEWPTYRPLLAEVDSIRTKYNNRNPLVPARKTFKYRKDRWQHATMLEILTVYEHVPKPYRENVLPNAFDSKGRPYDDIRRRLENAWQNSERRRESRMAAASVEEILSDQRPSLQSRPDWTIEGPSRVTPDLQVLPQIPVSNISVNPHDATASRSPSRSSSTSSVLSYESYRPGRSVSTSASSISERGSSDAPYNSSPPSSSYGSDSEAVWSPASSPDDYLNDDGVYVANYDPADDEHVEDESFTSRGSAGGTPWREINDRSKQSGRRYAPSPRKVMECQVVISVPPKPKGSTITTHGAGHSKNSNAAQVVPSNNVPARSNSRTPSVSVSKRTRKGSAASIFRASSSSASRASSCDASTSATSRFSPGISGLRNSSHNLSASGNPEPLINLFDYQASATLTNAWKDKEPEVRNHDDVIYQSSKRTKSTTVHRSRGPTEETDELYRLTPGLKRKETAPNSEGSQQVSNQPIPQQCMQYKGRELIDLTGLPEEVVKKEIVQVELVQHIRSLQELILRNNLKGAGTLDNCLTNALLAAERMSE